MMALRFLSPIFTRLHRSVGPRLLLLLLSLALAVSIGVLPVLPKEQVAWMQQTTTIHTCLYHTQATYSHQIPCAVPALSSRG